MQLEAYILFGFGISIGGIITTTLTIIIQSDWHDDQD
jgi:hypothetical protein